MNCQTVQKSLSSYLDRRLSASEKSRVSEHLAICGECAWRSEQYISQREDLRSLPKISVPAKLTEELFVVALRERIRRQQPLSWPAYWATRARLFIDNLMRPLALPCAGGLASAVFLFGVLVPTLGFPRNTANDVPTNLYTQASVENIAPFGFNNDDVVLELVINEQGRVVDYFVPKGQINRELASNIGNMILFTSFNPATMFGQPTSGRLSVSFRRSRIVVKG
jgi:hypothetical protein